MKRVHLRSDPFPEMKAMTVVRVTIGRNGQILKRPRKFYASQKGRDIVTWDITNAGDQPILVSVTDFLRRADCSDDEGTVPVRPFIWLSSDNVTLDPGQEGFIDGRVDPNYSRQNADDDDCLSYSITVESQATTAPFTAIDYDPDGDIKP
jgi:hypothetical protein